MRIRFCAVGVLAMALTPFVFADFQYQETTKITGGSIISMMKFVSMFSKQARQINEPVTSTVLVKGNRMAHINPEYTEIIDLDKETITRIDHTKREYTVVTFEQMKQQMQQAAEEMRRRQAEQQKQQPQNQQPQNQAELNFTANVRNTGATKQVSGLNTTEAILTMAMEAKDKQTGQQGALNITNDMWMAPDIPGYEEVREFQRKFATKFGTMFNQALGPQLSATNPGMGKGYAEMAKEMSKLKGTPVLQVTRMGSTPDGKPLPAASEAPLPPTPESPSVGEAAKEGAKESATSAITSKIGLGGFGGFGRKKKKEEQPKEVEASQKTDQQQAMALVLIESSVEMGGFSSAAIDNARFQAPAGYKQVEAPNRGMR